MKTVFITGATAGFGEACADIFAKNGYRLILNGRRAERLTSLQEKLQKKYNAACYLLPFDVQDKAAVQTAVSSLPEDWQAIDILVNNAGLALGRDPFDAANIDDWDTMINTNIKGLLYVSKAVVPYMVKRKSGHIINLGSIAAKQTADSVYEGYQPLVAEDVANIIYYCATLPPHVCINDLVVTPTQQANGIYFQKDGNVL
ncbi:MAG: SDR family NAD(P)-dependent oxidoreductase [Chitinophagaceae bacterium]|nr:MAG: SDR family NAD(P)-dependent oxidoreductase [Chitinophagaceae bacterium]